MHVLGREVLDLMETQPFTLFYSSKHANTRLDSIQQIVLDTVAS